MAHMIARGTIQDVLVDDNLEEWLDLWGEYDFVVLAGGEPALTRALSLYNEGADDIYKAMDVLWGGEFDTWAVELSEQDTPYMGKVLVIQMIGSLDGDTTVHLPREQWPT